MPPHIPLPPIRIFALPLLRIPLGPGGKLLLPSSSNNSDNNDTSSSSSQFPATSSATTLSTPLIYWHISQNHPLPSLSSSQSPPTPPISLLNPSSLLPVSTLPERLIDLASGVWLTWGKTEDSLRREMENKSRSVSNAGPGSEKTISTSSGSSSTSTTLTTSQPPYSPSLFSSDGFSLLAQRWKHRTWKTGESLMDRIAFEEWGLKAVKVVERSKGKETQGKDAVADKVAMEKIPLYIPSPSFLSLTSSSSQSPTALLKTYLSTRIPYHKTYLTRSLILLPFLAPIGLLPVVPNLPGFYVVWRAWSHWKARKGGEWVSGKVTAGGENGESVDVKESEELTQILKGSEGRSIKAEEQKDEDAKFLGKQSKEVSSATRPDELPNPESAEVAPDATGTPSSMIHPTSATATSNASTTVESRDPDLLIHPTDVPILAEKFSFSSAEVVDITRAVFQAGERLAAYRKSQHS